MMKHNNKITTQTIRLVCKLLNDPVQSQRSIATISGVSRRTVVRIKTKLIASGISNFNLNDISDSELACVFGTVPVPPHATSNIDWLALHNDMQKRDMTLQLAWEEYRSQFPDGISYATYCRQYRQWRKYLYLL